MTDSSSLPVMVVDESIAEKESPSEAVDSPEDNRPPRIVSLELTSTPVQPGMEIHVQAEGEDPDGDPVSFDFEWRRNGEPIHAAVFDILETGEFSKGDAIDVVVTPNDGRLHGHSQTSKALVLVNRPPEIHSSPPSSFVGEYVYEVQAVDPDGDPLTFALVEAPTGMTIDAETGRLSWVLPPAMDETVKVRLTVSDGEREIYQEFRFGIRQELIEQ